jgi:transposase-like protein
VGEAYTFVAIDVNMRMVLSYLVGWRDNASAAEFINDLRVRLTVMP